MITALEAKLTAYRKRSWFEIVERKISEAANNGDVMCTICVNEIPKGTDGVLYEIECLLKELGYQVTMDLENRDGLTMYVYWHAKKTIVYYNGVGGSESEE